MPDIKVKVKGCLDEHWAEWFEEFELFHNDKGETILVGKVEDQPALYGLITKLRDLGLSLVEITLSDESDKL